MATWAADRPLPPGYHRDPILWIIGCDLQLPRVSGVDFDAIFDTPPGATGNRLRTFGHPTLDGKGKAGVPHYIATRGTTPLHHDPAYPRYSVQVAIYNHGLALAGLDGHARKFARGIMYCLDTHSPHQVVTHGPTTLRRQKLQGAADYADEPPADPAAYLDLYEYIATTHPTKDTDHAP